MTQVREAGLPVEFRVDGERRELPVGIELSAYRIVQEALTEATRRIVRAQPVTKVLILTTFGLDDYVYDALRVGASGFMLKDAPRRDRSRGPDHRQRRRAARASHHPRGH
jgi:DNA-binding NarL/FixJ family response regulator